MKTQLISLFLGLGLAGCGLQMHHGRPDILTEHARYRIADQSDDDGRQIRFADFQGVIRKRWVNLHEAGDFPDAHHAPFNVQEVQLTLSGFTDVQAAMNYRQACVQTKPVFGAGDSLFGDEPVLLSGAAQVKQALWTVQNTALLENEAKDAIEVGGNRVRLNQRVIAEYHFSSGQPLGARGDYVWLDESLPDERRVLAALMVVYAMTYEAVSCALN
ncbi:hypothetical protein [Photobacterium sp. 1_MG-2023]|uniref:hypothetical protein n=1 Tax=Photobacterium sp. 1_MG-2023 TaxID=3062646 RepID=UPI0026E1253E|nr:hypothetical protein [Photobacterium sp. 1_MG-2023]MDO6704867.1 hypothetical protein [Photobacterium sp. 1_MG-2023]